MGKVWVLDTETKGTGANVVPLEKTLAEPAPKPVRRPRPAGAPPSSEPRRPAKPKQRVETSSSPLPPGHVRKKETGEIGKVQSVDPKAGTATVFWLKRGSASTVPLAAISRR
jgi:hypothetical protein